MASCYFCGCYIKNGEGYRRKVLVNESARIYFTKRGGGSYGQSYALRTLCQSCAVTLDERNKSFAWKFPISVIMAAIGFIGAARYAVSSYGSSDSALESLIYAFFLFGGLGFVTYALLSALERFSTNNEYSTQENEQRESSGRVTALEKKVYEADFLKNAGTPEERRGLEILFKFVMNNEGRDINSGDDFANMVIDYSRRVSLEEAKEFVGLLGRGKEEDVNIWFIRASKLAPLEISIEDATAWLKYVYKMAITLKVDLWFGLDESEEKKIKDQVLALM
jgi:hypothetical protein